MVESNQLLQVQNIIARLKQQHENNKSAPSKITKEEASISNHNEVIKTPKTAYNSRERLEFTDLMLQGNTNDISKLTHVLHKLKTSASQGQPNFNIFLNEISYNNETINNKPSNIQGKDRKGYISNITEKNVRKSYPDYYCKQHKRQKINHNNEETHQPHITNYFNIVKCVDRTKRSDNDSHKGKSFTAKLRENKSVSLSQHAKSSEEISDLLKKVRNKYTQVLSDSTNTYNKEITANSKYNDNHTFKEIFKAVTRSLEQDKIDLQVNDCDSCNIVRSQAASNNILKENASKFSFQRERSSNEISDENIIEKTVSQISIDSYTKSLQQSKEKSKYNTSFILNSNHQFQTIKVGHRVEQDCNISCASKGESGRISNISNGNFTLLQSEERNNVSDIQARNDSEVFANSYTRKHDSFSKKNVIHGECENEFTFDDVFNNFINKLKKNETNSETLFYNSCHRNISSQEKQNLTNRNSLPVTSNELIITQSNLSATKTLHPHIENLQRNISSIGNNEICKINIENRETACGIGNNINIIEGESEDNKSATDVLSILEKIKHSSNKENLLMPSRMQQIDSNLKIHPWEIGEKMSQTNSQMDSTKISNIELYNDNTFMHPSNEIDKQCSQRTCPVIYAAKNSGKNNFKEIGSLQYDTGISTSPTTGVSFLESKINLLDTDLEKQALTAVSRKLIKNHKKISESDKLNDLLRKMTPNIKKNTGNAKRSLFIKRYRKDNVRIYKIKRLRKKHLKVEEEKIELNLYALIEKVTSNNGEASLLRYSSGSSVSTSSSYITDDTKSDILSISSKLSSPQQRLRIGFNEIYKDKSLLYSAKEWKDIPEHDKEYIKMKLQDIFFQILQDFKNNKNSFFKHRKHNFDNCIFKNGILQLKPRSESSLTVISSKSQKSKVKFHLMLYIMSKIQTLLETDTKLTKREIFYQLKTLINNQESCDRAINAISCLLDVGMWALNIIAQKGLVFGDLKLLLSSGEMLNCNIPGTLIPQDINDIVEVHSTAYFILVVEKESIFQKFIEENLPNKLTRPFIMITGKGFPDLNTQLFLRKLWMIMSIPVFILVDADPHGINIMLNYRFGSVKNAHVSQYLAVPNAKWLGLYPSEILNMDITCQDLTEREVRLVECLLQTPYMQFSTKLVDELKILLANKCKAGIEGLMKTDNYLSDVYLPNKFFARSFI